MGSLGKGGIRPDSNPDHNRTKGSLHFIPQHLLSQSNMGEETHRVDRCPLDFIGLNEVANLRTNGEPDTIQRGVEDVVSNAVVVCHPFILIGSMLGNSSHIIGE